MKAPFFLVRLASPSTRFGSLPVAAVVWLVDSDGVSGVFVTSAGACSWFPVSAGFVLGFVFGSTAGITVVGVMVMFGFSCVSFLSTLDGDWFTMFVPVDDRFSGEGASPPHPIKPTANTPTPAKYFMGKIKPQAGISDKTICCQQANLTVVFRPLVVAENQPARLDRIKNRMTPFSSLAEACEAANAFIYRCNEPNAVDDFTKLALGLFAFQFSQNETYANLCRSECRTPDSVSRWEEIPAVPTRAFKSLDLTALPHSERHAVFRSSGTTQSERSLQHHNRSTLAVYETSLWAWFEQHMVDGNRGDCCSFFQNQAMRRSRRWANDDHRDQALGQDRTSFRCR